MATSEVNVSCSGQVIFDVVEYCARYRGVYDGPEKMFLKIVIEIHK
jgi:hypothetical protein